MKRNKFLQLTRSERRLLLSAALLLGAIRLGLWLLPFQTLRRLLVRITGETVAGGTSLCRQSRLGSGGGQPPCPASNVSLGLWLHRRCFASTVTSSHPHRCCSQPERQLQAHAWVESQGRIVSGGLKDLALYPTLEGKYNERDRWHLPLITGQWTAQIWQI